MQGLIPVMHGVNGFQSVSSSGDSFAATLAKKKTIDDVELKGKRILLRVDFNVPLTEAGRIADKQRILATLPTINKIINSECKILIIASHLGRPDGIPTSKLSLKPVAEELSTLLNKPVTFLTDCVGSSVEETCANMQNGAIIMLENLRFHAEEEGSGKDPKTKQKFIPTQSEVNAFRTSLSSLADIAINDAFGTLHRAHSSIVGLSTPIVAGYLVQKELRYFSKILQDPNPIDLAILGGAKVFDKIPLIENIIPRVRRLIIGGGMAYTFLHVINRISVGNSLFDEKGANYVKKVMKKANEFDVEIIFPDDFVVADSFSSDAKFYTVDAKSGVPDGWMGLDCGPKSIEKFTNEISRANSVLWNGPVGVFEFDSFSRGTEAILKALVTGTESRGLISIVGGGDSCAAVAKWNATDKLSHVSTGGGASLELMEGKELPGIKAICNK